MHKDERESTMYPGPSAVLGDRYSGSNLHQATNESLGAVDKEASFLGSFSSSRCQGVGGHHNVSEESRFKKWLRH